MSALEPPYVIQVGTSDPIYASANKIITVGHPEFGFSPVAQNTQASASGPWITANKPCALPLTFFEDVTVRELGWVNGSAAGGNLDIGIYDTSWNRLVSAGSTLCTGNSVPQWVNVTDTPINAGRYYLVAVRDNTTANRQLFMNDEAYTYLMSFCGVQDSATDSFPLPDPLVGMAAASIFTRLPNLQIATRPVFV